MKILYMSDLHLEFGSRLNEIVNPSLNFDVLVIAGDVNISNRTDESIRTIAELIAPRMLFVVTGNHDYYRGSIEEVDEKLIALEDEVPNYKFLNHQVVACDDRGNDIYFLGATGWQINPRYNHINFSSMNDFRLIENHPKLIQSLGRNDVAFLKDSLDDLKGEKIVIVTHIPPTLKSIDTTTPYVINKGSYIDAYYNDMDDIIEEYDPKLWICGHMHDSCDVTLPNGTRVVRNTFGYEGYDDGDGKNGAFLNNFIVEV